MQESKYSDALDGDVASNPYLQAVKPARVVLTTKRSGNATTDHHHHQQSSLYGSGAPNESPLSTSYSSLGNNISRIVLGGGGGGGGNKNNNYSSVVGGGDEAYNMEDDFGGRATAAAAIQRSSMAADNALVGGRLNTTTDEYNIPMGEQIDGIGGYGLSPHNDGQSSDHYMQHHDDHRQQYETSPHRLRDDSIDTRGLNDSSIDTHGLHDSSIEPRGFHDTSIDPRGLHDTSIDAQGLHDTSFQRDVDNNTTIGRGSIAVRNFNTDDTDFHSDLDNQRPDHHRLDDINNTSSDNIIEGDLHHHQRNDIDEDAALFGRADLSSSMMDDNEDNDSHMMGREVTNTGSVDYQDSSPY